MEKFLKAKKIAVIGASDKKNKIGNILIKNLKKSKINRKIFPINLKDRIVCGFKSYRSILEIEDNIDLVIIAIPAQFVIAAIEECVAKKVKNIVIISAGFSESGKEGVERERKLIEISIKNKLNILGPNCLGFINNNQDLNCSFAKNEVSVGEIGLVSQSGAFVTGILDVAKGNQIGFSKIITLGNKAILDEIDFLNYLAKDPKTKIIGLYLENIERGRLFYNTIAKITKKKPVLILKAGSSEKVQKAIMSHTGSMAGEIEVIKKAFLESGALYFDNMFDFWQTLVIFNKNKQLQNNNLVVLTNAGGPGVISTDLIEKEKSLDFYEFNEKEKRALVKVLPSAASVENPIDVLGDADSDRYGDCLDSLVKMKKIGGILALITPQAQTDVENILKTIEKKEKNSRFPIFPILIGEKRKDTFQFPWEAIKNLSKVIDHQKNQKNSAPFKKEPKNFNVLMSQRVRKFAEEAQEEKREMFYYKESMELMRYHGIRTLKARLVKGSKDSPEFKEKSFIMKVDDPKIIHKMAQGAIKVGIKSKFSFNKNLKQLQIKFKNKKVIIQEEVEKGTEIIIGIKKDSNFGPVLMCGMGGILTEIFNEKLLWILPVNKNEIKKDLKNSKIGKIFKKEGLGLDCLVKEVSKVSEIGWRNNWIKELDINPMFFYSDSKKPLAVDVKVKIDKV